MDALQPRITEDETEEALTPSSVPFFQRPMGASENDQWVGQDEAGNNLYKMANGNTYTVKPNADQRTTRTKVQEDVVPAIKEFAKDPSLPTTEQMKELGYNIVQGTYDSVKGAVEGTGTMGDVFGVVPGMAALSAGAEVPEGAIRIFGGKRAYDPGYNRSGNQVPKSTGADGKPRFEINDSEMYLVPSSIPKLDGSTQLGDNQVPPLSAVMVHDELLYQYPQIGKMGIFADESLDDRTWGYFDPRTNRIAINPALLKADRADDLKRLMVHEIQHKVQAMEGFTTGTNTGTGEVRVMTQARINSPENKAQWEEYEKKVEDLWKPDNLLGPVSYANEFIQHVAKTKGIDLEAETPEPSFLSGVAAKVGIGKKEPPEAKYLRTLHQKLNNTLSDLESGKIKRDFIPAEIGKLNQAYRALGKFASKDPKLSSAFSGITGISPNQIDPDLDTGLDAFDFFYETPKTPDLPSPGNGYLDERALWSTYARKRGEAEAESAAARIFYTDSERKYTPPEMTEPFPREEQWGEPSPFNEGGLVEKQMKAFNEGGLADDGQTKDPVSGNEVPAGSMAKEVRDDVDAKLSEGEYVVPADVVRYFGVSYFEKLRERAKKGLGEMESDGRIGGEPVEEEGDDLPFSDEELMAMDEAAAAQPQAQGAPVGMAEGGAVAAAPKGPSTMVKEYVNAAGDKRSIMFVGDQPVQHIPAGFSEASVAAGTKTDLTEPGKADSVEETDPQKKEQQKLDEGDGTDQSFAGAAADGFGAGFNGAQEAANANASSGSSGTGTGFGGMLSGIGDAISGAFGGGGSSGGSGPSAGAGDSGSNGGMGGYANRGMLVNKRVKQKKVEPKPEGKGLVKRKPKK